MILGGALKGFGQRYLAFRNTTDKVSTNNILFQTPAVLDRSCTPALLDTCTPALLDSYWVLAQLPDSDLFNTTLVCSRCTLTACGREARPNRPKDLRARLQWSTADRRSRTRPVGPKTNLSTNGSRIGRSGAMTSILRLGSPAESTGRLSGHGSKGTLPTAGPTHDQ